MPSPQHQTRKHPAEIRNRARTLQLNQGVPYREALQVALGERSLAEFLQQLLRQERITKLMASQQLDMSRAMLVVDKKRTLDEVLVKLRARQNLSQAGRHARLQQLFDSHTPVGLQVDPARTAIGRIQALSQFELTLETQAGEIETVRKLDLHYFFEAGDLPRVQKAIKLDRQVQGRDLGPELAPGKRTHFKHAVFQGLIESQKDAAVTTRRGQVLRGKVVRFDLYEVDLKLSKGPLVTFCRHALLCIDQTA